MADKNPGVISSPGLLTLPRFSNRVGAGTGPRSVIVMAVGGSGGISLANAAIRLDMPSHFSFTVPFICDELNRRSAVICLSIM